MKYILITLAVFLTGCSSMDTFVCRGAGTCFGDERDQQYAWVVAPSGSSSSSSFSRGGVITTNSGNYVIVPRATGGLPMAVIRSGK